MGWIWSQIRSGVGLFKKKQDKKAFVGLTYIIQSSCCERTLTQYNVKRLELFIDYDRPEVQYQNPCTIDATIQDWSAAQILSI